MLTGHGFSLKFAHISLLFAGLMWVFPFLDYYHAFPLTTFYQEWGAALLGLAAMPLLVARTWRSTEVPRVILLPVGLLVLVVVQFALGKLPYFGQMLLYALYLIWAALLIMVGRRLREDLGLPAAATALAAFLLAGAELNAAIGMIQHFGWHGPFDRVVTAKISDAVWGNVAQANHYSDYLSLGLASLGLLFARGTLRAWQAALLAAPILFVLPLTGSRETWAYPTAMVVVAFLVRRTPSGRPLLGYSLLVLLGFGLMHLTSQIPAMAGASGSVNTLQRMFAENVHSGSIRLHLLREAWMMFTQFPVLGAGFGQFAWQHFLLAPSLHQLQINGLYNNAHNLVMQLAAEGGAVGLLTLLAPLGAWLRQAWSAERSAYQWWGCTVLVILGIHSMFEYPLWYAYFLGIAALLLGMFDDTGFRIEMHGVRRAFVVLSLVLGLLSLQQLFAGYRAYEGLTALRPEPGNEAAYVSEVRNTLAKMDEYALLQPYARKEMSSIMIQVGPDRLADKLAMNGDASRFIPGPRQVYHQALLLAQGDDLPAAKAQMERAVWSYAGDFPETERELRDLAAKDPGRFAPLLEFALQKQQEYQRELHAVHTN